jgi:tetratricopeptide (TPR) repeat protein
METSLPSHWGKPASLASERTRNGISCPMWQRCVLVFAILALTDPLCRISWAQSPSSSTSPAQHMTARQAYSEGIDLLRRRRIDDAVVAFRRAVEADAGFAAAWAELGLALEGLERHEQAAEALERALALRPDYSIARYILGTACNALGRWDNALGCFEEILSKHPSFVAYPEFHYQRGRALMGLHRWNDAAESMCEAVRINPNYSQAHWELARIYDMLGFAPLGEEARRTALHLDPSLRHLADLPGLEETPTLPAAAAATGMTVLGK